MFILIESLEERKTKGSYKTLDPEYIQWTSTFGVFPFLKGTAHLSFTTVQFLVPLTQTFNMIDEHQHTNFSFWQLFPGIVGDSYSRLLCLNENCKQGISNDHDFMVL